MTSFKVVFIGAGAVNFGTPRAPWNHSARLEEWDPSPFYPRKILIQGPGETAQGAGDNRPCSTTCSSCS